jgi:hypothetical protein
MLALFMTENMIPSISIYIYIYILRNVWLRLSAIHPPPPVFLIVLGKATFVIRLRAREMVIEVEFANS